MESDDKVLAAWRRVQPGTTVVPATQTRPSIHLLLLVTTLFTTTVAGALWEGVEPFHDFRLLARGLPFSLTLSAILLTHEAGHWLMCLRHRVSASLPYFLPAPPTVFPLGTFGAFIRIRSRFPDRRALFDVGAAGPWAGFVVAIAALLIGLPLSTVIPRPLESPVLELGDSLLTAWLTGAMLHADPASVVLHPIAFAGWIGLLVTSINLLPVGQLDGGHVLYAAFRRRMRLVPLFLIAFLAWLGLRAWQGWVIWAVILAVMLALGHPPTLDDERPLDPRRTAGAFASFVLFVLTFVPEPFRIAP